MGKYYIASCVFTSQYPKLSTVIQDYVRDRYGLTVVRCCVPKYKIKEFTEKMPEGEHRDLWSSLPDSADFKSGDEIYSLCHNCNNIIEEMHPGTKVLSLWELLDADEKLLLPNYDGMEVTIQDCWRSRNRSAEQRAVRSLLSKMNIKYRETCPNMEQTDFCGASLFRAQPPRNPKLAPKHYVEGAEGKFLPHTTEEQIRLMEDYCRRYTTKKVLCYCHYCLEGLRMGGVEGIHIAQLIFD